MTGMQDALSLSLSLSLSLFVPLPLCLFFSLLPKSGCWTISDERNRRESERRREKSEGGRGWPLRPLVTNGQLEWSTALAMKTVGEKNTIQVSSEYCK